MNRRGFLAGLFSLPVLNKVFIPEVLAKTPTLPYEVLPYKGKIMVDAGVFYCPYIPLQVKDSKPSLCHQPTVFKTRYGEVTKV